MNSIRTEATPADQVSLPCASRDGENTEISKFGWGGPRANSGGKRAGAGRKRKPKELKHPQTLDVPTSPDIRWYCVRTEFRAEDRVEDAIRRIGLPVVVFRKFHEARKTRRGKPDRDRYAPLFPRYVFVAFALDDPRWRAIHEEPGVAYLFSSSAECPTPLPQQPIDWLLARCDEKGVWLKEKPRPDYDPFKPGTAVQILDGPFASFFAIVRVSDARRFVVEASIFGRSAPVELTRADVRLA